MLRTRYYQAAALMAGLVLLLGACQAGTGGAPANNLPSTEATPVQPAPSPSPFQPAETPTASPSPEAAAAFDTYPSPVEPDSSPTAEAVVMSTETTAPTPEADLAFTPQVALELVADGMTAPIAMSFPRDDSGRLFIADQMGVVWVLSAEGQRLEEPFLDLRERMVNLQPGYDERGLLGLVFHPDFRENGRFFVYYSAPLRQGATFGWNHTSHISEFRVLEGQPEQADPQSERILLQVDQPQANHNGGQILFGRDGYLYIALGDGGGANDMGLGHPGIGNGQDVNTLLGSILRIDVNHVDPNGPPYAIPPDNPFANGGGAHEIFAYGFRNPFRMSFDANTGQFFAADVGQNLWEEVNVVIKGGNYGWNLREGTHCFSAASPNQPPETCPASGPMGEPLNMPVIEYANSRNPAGGVGTAVIGGFVYRGTELSGFQGRYIFGDWSSGSGQSGGVLLASTPSDGQRLWNLQEIAVVGTQDESLSAYLLSFGQDQNLELYVLVSDNTGPSGETGRVYRLVSP